MAKSVVGKGEGMIGLEIHAYIVTGEKLFCKCVASREKGLKKNINICPICTGQPGAKPMLPNSEAVEKAVRIGLMLGCEINKNLEWQRKHYSWPDMPKGYQNTFSGGFPGVGVNGEFGGIGIWSMHLEEDPAAWDPESGCVDYNRSGLPLVEIVTAPDFGSSGEVVEWLKKLIHNLAYLKVVDKNAGIKADVNVNLVNHRFTSPKTSMSREKVLGIHGKTERVEIKNINSIENIGKAIEYELERQAEEGSVRETRRFDAQKGKTFRMRGKEGDDDYRFINDPDLIDVNLDDGMISKLKKGLPERPEEKLEKFIKKHKIGKKDAEVLIKHIDIAEFFEKVIEEGKEKFSVGFALPWVTIELLRHLNYNNVGLDGVEIEVEHFVELLNLVEKGKISVLKGKEILNKFYPKSFNVKNVVKKEGKISDEKELGEVIKKVVGENKKSVEDYKNGEKKALNYLMGQVMQKTNRRADFKIALKVLLKILG